MRLHKRLGGWRMVERYGGFGTVAGEGLGEQSTDYRIQVWEQFLNGRGGRYKIEGDLSPSTLPQSETEAELVLEKGIRLRLRVFPDGRVLGDSAPVFPKSRS